MFWISDSVVQNTVDLHSTPGAHQIAVPLPFQGGLGEEHKMEKNS